jgi:DNA-binding XRE family transcriptional regulator
MLNRVNYDLSKTTPGEALFLARKAAGRTQPEAARALGVGLTAYGEAERDEKPLSRRVAPLKRAVARDSRVLILLARRRSGLGVFAIAKACGVSRPTLLAVEIRGDEGLKFFWSRQGFKFPKEKRAK